MTKVPVFHCCALDKECRADLKGFGGAPWRFSICIKGNKYSRYYGIALRPSDRYVQLLDGGGYKARWTTYSKKPLTVDR